MGEDEDEDEEEDEGDIIKFKYFKHFFLRIITLIFFMCVNIFFYVL